MDAEPAESFLRAGMSALPWKVHPIEALKRCIASNGLAADILLCPGDLTHKCSVPGLRSAWDSVNDIAAALGARQILGTIGNHDVDSRARNGQDPFAPARAVSNTFPLSDYGSAGSYWANGYSIVDIDDGRMVVLNSVADHTDPESAAHGSISEETLEALESAIAARPASALTVALVHHHPHLHEDIGLGTSDVMHNGQLLLNLLSRLGITLVVHGHKHHPKLSYAAGGATSPVVFAAGSLSHIPSPQLASNTRNLFHIVDVSRATLPSCTVQGEIFSWEFNAGVGWNPSTERSAGFPRRAGFGCRLTTNQAAAMVAPSIDGLVSWDDLATRVQELRYLIPQDRASLFSELRSRGIKILFGEDGEPEELLK